MLINGNGVMKAIVRLVERENKLMAQSYELAEKFASAENLKNEAEMRKIGVEGLKLRRKTTIHCLEVCSAMTMAISNNPFFKFN